MGRFDGRRIERIRRDKKIRHSKAQLLEAQVSGILALLIIILGLLYLSDALHYAWTLFVIIVLAIAMNAILILKRVSGKKKSGKE